MTRNDLEFWVSVDLLKPIAFLPRVSFFFNLKRDSNKLIFAIFNHFFKTLGLRIFQTQIMLKTQYFYRDFPSFPDFQRILIAQKL